LIDPSHSFFIVWLRYVEIHNTTINTDNDTVVIYGTVALTVSEPSNLNQTIEEIKFTIL
jgi:hypothetical protein